MYGAVPTFGPMLSTAALNPLLAVGRIGPVQLVPPTDQVISLPAQSAPKMPAASDADCSVASVWVLITLPGRSFTGAAEIVEQEAQIARDRSFFL